MMLHMQQTHIGTPALQHSQTLCTIIILSQATYTGFGDITADAVFKVCDQPHPVLVQKILADCAAANLGEAYKGMKALCDMGYSAIDIITTVYRVRCGLAAAAAAVSLLLMAFYYASAL
jgi:hypothetical protein